MKCSDDAPASLPDDPRDCCRAALKIMGDDFDDAEELVSDLIDVIFSALLDESLPANQVRGLLGRVQDAVARLQADAGKVRQLVRHGAGDNREMDKRLAERAKAIDEGREPPYEPTGYEVRGAMIASAAAGKPISQDEAVALLRAAQPPREAA